MSNSEIAHGWAPIIASSVGFGLAFGTRRVWFGFVAAVIAAPFCLFASGYPLLHWVARVALGANFLSAYLIYRRRRDIAFAVLLPFMIITIVLAIFWARDIVLMHE
jgi:hypothetical protein